MHVNIRDRATHRMCTECRQRHAQTLKTLCCVKILHNDSLVNQAVHLKSHIMIFCLMEAAVNYTFDPLLPSTQRPIVSLLEFWPYDEINVGELNKQRTGTEILIKLVLERFVINSTFLSLQRPTNSLLKKLVMVNGKRVKQSWIE